MTTANAIVHATTHVYDANLFTRDHRLDLLGIAPGISAFFLMKTLKRVSVEMALLVPVCDLTRVMNIMGLDR